MGGFQNNRKRPRELDTFNSSNVGFNMPPKELDEFRPMQIIDYQNKTQSYQPFENQASISSANSSLNVPKPTEVFFRKIIEYDHKTKIHPFNWFCPVVQIEYNHTANGLSLHEHPPPKPVKKEPEPSHRFKQEQRDEHQHVRQPKWMPNERQERYRGPVERNYQMRFENRPNAPMNSQMPSDNQPYYGRNQREQNWSRNYHDFNAPSPDYGYER